MQGCVQCAANKLRTRLDTSRATPDLHCACVWALNTCSLLRLNNTPPRPLVNLWKSASLVSRGGRKHDRADPVEFLRWRWFSVSACSATDRATVQPAEPDIGSSKRPWSVRTMQDWSSSFCAPREASKLCTCQLGAARGASDTHARRVRVEDEDMLGIVWAGSSRAQFARASGAAVYSVQR